MVTHGRVADSSASASATPSAEADAIAGLLIDALKKLAKAGEVDAACRIAGKACAVLRRGAHNTEQRFNILLHRLAPRLQEQDLG